MPQKSSLSCLAARTLLLSRARLITTVECAALTSSTTMSAAEYYSDLFVDVVLPKNELLEIHRSKISLHRAKADYSYPTLRLPHIFAKLAGLQTRIYQTVHAGALAFLVVLSSTSISLESRSANCDNATLRAKSAAFTRR